MPHKLGDKVRQKVKVIEGAVVDGRYNMVAGKFQWEVAYEGEDGQPTSRWFDDDQIELVPAEEAEAEGGAQ